MFRLIGSLLFILLTLAPAGFLNAAQTVLASPYQIHFIPHNEVAKLELVQRTKYVRALRRLIVDTEKMQFSFRGSLYADAGSLKSRQQFEELFATILGEEAYAANDDNSDGGRGREATDKCISAYAISTYPNTESGKRQPFLCQVKEKCTGSNGPGVRCDKFSGIPASDPRSCIPASLAYHSTVECETLRQEMASNKPNIDKSNQAIARASKFFSASGRQSQLTPADLQSDEAKAILKDLTDTAYIDASFAERTMLLAIYKQAGAPLPTAGLEDQYASIDPTKFSNEFNWAQTALTQISSSYVSHCEHTLSAAEIKNLRDPKWAQRAEQMGRKAWELEKQRIDALKALDSGVAPTIENVLEIDECRSAKVRIAAASAAIGAAVQSGPVQTPPNGAPPQPTPPLRVDNTEVTTTGCSSNVGRIENHLEHPAARCMVCMAERAMSRAADNHQGDAAAYDNHKYYSASTKWFGLLSTMTLACGDGVANNSAVHADVMGCYIMAFGHCSGDTYDWDPAGRNMDASMREDMANDPGGDPITVEQLSQCDTFLTRTWSDQGFWSNRSDEAKANYFEKYEKNNCGRIARREEKRVNKGKKSEPDMNKDFARVYGISYDHATKLFCDPSRVSKTFWTGRVKAVDEKSAMQKCDPNWIAATRARFEKTLPTLGVELTKSPNGKSGNAGNPLLACFKESNKNANELYAPGTNYCFRSTTMGTGYNPNAYNRMIDQLKQGVPAVLWETGSCSISKQYEERTFNDPRNGQQTVGRAAVFVNPRDQADGKNLYNQIRTFYNNGETDIPTLTTFPNSPQAKGCRPGDKSGICAEFQRQCPDSGPDKRARCQFVYPLSPDETKYISYTYEDPSACTPSGSASGTSNGNKQTK